MKSLRAHGFVVNGNHLFCQQTAFYLPCTLDVLDPHCCSCLCQSHIHSDLSCTHSHLHDCAGLLQEGSPRSGCASWGPARETGDAPSTTSSWAGHPSACTACCCSLPNHHLESTGTSTRSGANLPMGTGRSCSRPGWTSPGDRATGRRRCRLTPTAPRRWGRWGRQDHLGCDRA